MSTRSLGAVRARPPRAPAFLLGLGLGLGGFVDGIVLHQVLQWHHMLTDAGESANTVAGLVANTLADGFFHLATWFLVAGTWSQAAFVLEPLGALGKQGTERTYS